MVASKEAAKRDSYHRNPGFCKQCNEPLPYEKRKCSFCSASCSTTFTNLQRSPRSDESRQKVSQSLKEYNQNNVRPPRTQPRHKRKNRKVYICVVCGSSCPRRTKTCSRECFIANQRANALKQQRHGGGKKGKYKGIYCDSSWELAFLIYHLDHKIAIQRCKDVREYIKNGEVRSYNPDFVVGDVIYEIKGFMCKTAKLKLDQNPDIIVIDKEGIKPYIKYIKDTYGVGRVEDLYEEKGFNLKIGICKHCKKDFEFHSRNRKFCTISCARSRSTSMEVRKKISKSVQHHYANKGVSFIFSDGGLHENIDCLKSWCIERDLDYDRVYRFVNKGIITHSVRYPSATRDWFVGKSIERA